MMLVKRLYLLSQILNTNTEFRPKPNDQNWIELNGYKIMKLKMLDQLCDKTTQSIKIEYTICNKLVSIMKKFTKIYLSINTNLKDETKNRYNDDVSLIYVAQDISTNEIYIGYTKSPLYVFIKFSLHKNNLNEDNVFNKFTHKTPKNKKFKLLEFVYSGSRMNVLERKKYYKINYAEQMKKLK